MDGKRVLIVGEFCRSSFGAEYYNTSFALQNGFVRIGCNVLTFSDRDVARESSFLRRKRLGQRAMNRRLVDTARTYRPHVILFGHVDMTDGDTLAALREAVPDVRLAQFNVDALFRKKSMSGFRARAKHMDVSFVTTASPERLKRFAPRPGSMAFFPNPVDTSLAHVDVSQLTRQQLDYDGIFLGNGDIRREAQVRELQAGLPQDFRFFAGGKIFGTPRLNGPAFLETLGRGAMSPNLPLDETESVHFLYSSNRIAQLLGLGLVAFCHETARLEQLYEDGIVTYASTSDLAAKMGELAHNDTERQRIGALGRRIGRERTSAEQIARYMLDHVIGDGPCRDYGWPSERI